MNIRTATVLTVIVLGLSTVGMIFLRHPDEPTHVKKLSVNPPLRQRTATKVVDADLDVESLSQNEVRLLSGDLNEAKTPGRFEMTKTVRSGETFLGEVYEGTHGEFVYSKITPTVRKLADGTSVVDVKINSFAVSFLDGERKLFSNHKSDTFQVPEKSNVVIGQSVTDGSYIMGLGVEIKESGQKIKIHAVGQHHVYKRQ